MSAPANITVVDYGMGNRRSVQKALEHVGAIVTVTGDAERLQEADGLVVPGVGAFPAAMLFVRSKSGISHNPAEYTSPGDLGLAVESLTRFVIALAKARS